MAALKFGRNYSFGISFTDGSTLTIEPPFTIEFDITRNILSSANVCQIRFYNLSKNNRNRLRYDFSNSGQLWPLILRAGYGQNLPTIFAGNVSQAWSVREGTNFITTVECFDGGFAFVNGVTSEQFPANTPQTTILKTLASNLPGVSVGAIGSYPGSISRGNAYVGSTIDILRELSGGGFFIDNGKANILGNNECLQGELQVINSDTGLLGTPVREQTIVNFDMLFEPRLIVGQLIQLESGTDENFNGLYKVISVKHRGMISESVSGDAITSVGFFYGAESLVTVPQS